MALDAEQLLRALAATQEAVSGEIRPSLDRLVVDTAERYPKLDVPTDAAAAQIGRALAEAEPSAWGEELDARRGPELMLAAALARGDDHATAVFERELIPEIDRAVRRYAADDDELAELRQRALVHLLVADPPQPPKIASYLGRGSLEGWVRTVAARLALNTLRSAPKMVDDETLLDRLLISAPALPGVAQHRALFVDALRKAIVALPRRERTLLRLSYVTGMTGVALARSYDVHESTVSRWLAAARDQLVAEFERIVTTELGDRAAIQDILSAVSRDFDASLAGLFATKAP